jgi:hypothetical protein
MRPTHELTKSWAPGFHDVSISEDTLGALRLVADAIIPGDSNYPSASAAGVVEFIVTRISEQDLQQLESLLHTRPPAQHGAEAIRRWLSEAASTEAFTLLRWYVYTAYYASPRVTDAMNRRGFDYHGPPQPLGYRIDVEAPVPDHRRGSYVPTDEVRRVTKDV